MSYATISDVQGLNAARTIGASSTPNASQVGRFIDMTAAEIDSILVQKGYSLPIPTMASSALSYLSHVNALGAWQMTEQSSPNSPHLPLAVTMYANALKMLGDADQVLDIPKSAGRSAPRGPGFTVPPVGFVATPYFTRRMEF